MSFLSCPDEVQLMIFENLDEQDIRRTITTCRQWYNLAQSMAVSDLDADTRGLSHFLGEGSSLVPDIEKKLQHIKVTVTGFSGQFYTRAIEPLESDNATWVIRLNESVNKLSVLLARCPKLESVQFHLLNHAPGTSVLPSPYLHDATLKSLYQTSHTSKSLTSLTIDICSSTNSLSGDGDGTHICPHLAELLLTLRYLNVRARSLCPDVFKKVDPAHDAKLECLLIFLDYKPEVAGTIGQVPTCLNMKESLFLRLRWWVNALRRRGRLPQIRHTYAMAPIPFGLLVVGKAVYQVLDCVGRTRCTATCNYWNRMVRKTRAALASGANNGTT